MKNQPCHKLQEGEENLDGVATLVTDLAPGYSTTKQNPHICNQPLYGWHELAVGEIRKLAAALARQSGQEEKEARGHLLQRLSVSLMRGNGALFVNRIPDSVEADIDGQE